MSGLIYPLAARSHLHMRLGRWPAALSDAAEALRLGEVTGHALAMGHTLGALAEIEAVLGQDAAAREHGERCVALAQAQGSETTADLRQRRAGAGRARPRRAGGGRRARRSPPSAPRRGRTTTSPASSASCPT